MIGAAADRQVAKTWRRETVEDRHLGAPSTRRSGCTHGERSGAPVVRQDEEVGSRLLGHIGLGIILLSAASCGGDDSGGGRAEALSTTSASAPPSSILRPFTAAELNVQLDPNGRPYDAAVVGEVETETRPLDLFHFARGQVRVMDGNAYQVDPSAFGSELVDFGQHEDLQVSVVWERAIDTGGENVLGVRLDVPGTEVAEWSRFRHAYGTDGGVGAVTSTAVVRRAEQHLTDDEQWVPDPDYGVDIEVFNLDGLDGPDSIVFSNGFGDGAFPMSEGLDPDGDLVSLMIWDPRYPWRLAVDDGTPPPDVTDREDEIIECIAGRRPVLVHPNEFLHCT